MLLCLLCLCLGGVLSPGRGLDFRYHDAVELERYLRHVNDTYPGITHLHSIGRSVEGRELWVLVLGSHAAQHQVGIPEFKYVGNMHGNEVVGRVLLLQLIDHLTRGYHSDPVVGRVLNSTRVHILPSMNPDGFHHATRDCMFSEGRFNQNGVDLNRDFPDAFSRGAVAGVREAEVQAVMDWLDTETFVLSANLHGGALVASYPYDNSNAGPELQGGYSVSPDNDVFVHLAKTYSFKHASMHHGNHCHDTTRFLDGITNGYSWYQLPGGMQDYNYVWGRCLEVTLEVSCCKFPEEAELPGLWADNKAALLAYMEQVHLGVKGQVLDGRGRPAQNAVVEVEGRSNICPFRTDRYGEYYRLLLPGNYSFKVTYPGHQVLRETLSVPYGPDSASALTHHFLLQQATTATPSQAPPSQICNSPGGGATALRPLPLPFLPLLLLLLLAAVPESWTRP